MEKIFYIVLLFVFNIPISYSQSSWFWLNPTPQGRELNKIELINNGFGVAAGINGSMIRSSNGGNNWININTNFNLNFRSITFVDESLGFAVEGSQVLKTTDGGYNWSQLYYEPPNSLQDILFINSKTGFICGEYFVAPVYYFGTVSKTTNGGISWFHPTLPLFLSPISSLSILDSFPCYPYTADLPPPHGNAAQGTLPASIPSTRAHARRTGTNPRLSSSLPATRAHSQRRSASGG